MKVLLYKLKLLAKLSRITSPTGIFLLYFPCCFGIALSNLSIYQVKYYETLLIFLSGSIIMRSFGCVVNDLLDKDFDKLVERTKDRPLACGKVTVKEAILLLIFLLFLGALVVLHLSLPSIIFCTLSLSLVFIYPLMKRFYFCPQLILGLTFNIGILVSYLYLENLIILPVWISYLGCIFWTLGYDTIYAFMDAKYDKLAEIKSFALVIQKKHYKLYIGCFYLIFVTLSTTALYLTKAVLPLRSCLTMSIALSILMWQVITLDIDSPSNCLKRFKSNNYVGLFIYFSFL